MVIAGEVAGIVGGGREEGLYILVCVQEIPNCHFLSVFDSDLLPMVGYFALGVCKGELGDEEGAFKSRVAPEWFSNM